MAKRKSTHILHMPVPAKFAFAILAIAVMVYGLFLASMYTSSNQTQTIQSHAATRLSRCGPSPVRKCPINYYHVCSGGTWHCYHNY